MRSMFQLGVNPGFFWMGNGGRGGRSTAYGNDDDAYRYCDPSMEPCPVPLVSPIRIAGMGQTFTIDRDGLLRNLTLAENQYAAVQDWLSKTMNPRDALGADADDFQAKNSKVMDIYDDIGRLDWILRSDNPSDWKITQDENIELQTFSQFVQTLYAYLQVHGYISGQPGTAPSPVKGPTVPPASVKPAGTPGAKGPVTVAPSPSISPVVIGVGAAAAVGIVIAALA